MHSVSHGTNPATNATRGESNPSSDSTAVKLLEPKLPASSAEQTTQIRSDLHPIQLTKEQHKERKCQYIITVNNRFHVTGASVVMKSVSHPTANPQAAFELA